MKSEKEAGMHTDLLFQEAEKLILNKFKILSEELGFNEAETTYKVIDSAAKKVAILVHEKLKILLEEEHGREKHLASMDFYPKKEALWLITLRADGMEFFYFEQLLGNIISKLKEQKATRVSSNNEKLRKSIQEAIKIANVAAKRISNKTYYRKKVYYASIRINGARFVFSNKDPEKLATEIIKKMPALIVAMVQVTKK